MGFKSIIFDFDGTLVDSKWDIAHAQLWVLQQLGIQCYREEDLFQHIGTPLEMTFTALLPRSLHHRVRDAARMYSEYYETRSLQTTKLFPGVKQTLRILHNHRKGLAVASIKRSLNIKQIADQLRIGTFFAQLQGSEFASPKPDPAILHMILEAQGWESGDTLMVGDTASDILAGKNAGMSTCAVTYGSSSRERLEAFNPDYIIAGFPEILSIV
jgi:phosphoglycolate phosphatase